MRKIRLTGFRSVLRPFLGTIVKVNTDLPLVALTFDDGPHPIYTPALLEILAKHNVKATFFLIGRAAALHPELVHQIQSAGHVLGNHSWSHPSFVDIPARQRKEQIRRWEQTVGLQTNKLFRPPYGHQNINSRLQMWWLGYQVVTWNIAIHDWLPISVDEVKERLCQQIRPGAIILLHDSSHRVFSEALDMDCSTLLFGLDQVLELLHSSYRFVTVPDLMSYGRSTQVIWNMEREV